MKVAELRELQRSVKQCPFCGGPARLAPMTSAKNWWRVRCEAYRCGGTIWAMPGYQEAIEAWNRSPDVKE